MGVFKSAIEIDAIIGPQRFLCDDFVDPFIFPFGRIDEITFFDGEDRPFGIDLGSRPAIKPVNGSAICNPVGCNDRTVGGGKALAQNTAVEGIHILILELSCPLISGCISL